MSGRGRAVYLDLDGTLLGPGGSLLTGAGGTGSDAGARALLMLADRGVPVVLVSGRSRARLATTGALLGATRCLPELGACDCGHPTAPGQTVHQAIAATGIVDELLRREPGLREHAAAMWGREGSHVLVGLASPDAAAWVRERSEGTLRLADNGEVLPDTHVFHLLPSAASKAAAVARDLAQHDLDGSRCLAVGDSAEDMALSAHVGAVALTRNGADADPGLAATVPWITLGAYGAGVLEAVVRWLDGPPASEV